MEKGDGGLVEIVDRVGLQVVPFLALGSGPGNGGQLAGINQVGHHRLVGQRHTLTGSGQLDGVEVGHRRVGSGPRIEGDADLGQQLPPPLAAPNIEQSGPGQVGQILDPSRQMGMGHRHHRLVRPHDLGPRGHCAEVDLDRRSGGSTRLGPVAGCQIEFDGGMGL